MRSVYPLMFVLLLSACVEQPQKPEVTQVLIGSDVNERQEIIKEKSVFSAKDTTFHAHVFTKGLTEPMKLSGSWWYVPQSRKIFETKSEVTPEFPVAKFLLSNSKGWPAGEYRFEVSGNEGLLSEKTIQVQEAE
ncbi:hypothetical protein COU78_03165 [Candidatus Peregrinibacteria bacterium CG10_big_fil_rev_8_21_14_0_10_49_24]|nr:MAG: hypothetical protein COV83_04985 [Candidatus Peregrinibacteria bacterium CG11_big_fil_rev_8_21_14_0_20_49_14]PIR51125.1 MAG: hypothetical protein COU78_03165 [Candidatus Peregrinibacteria bacterium CG10_big_fil_rev_8_21_14_0_10_49_24]